MVFNPPSNGREKRWNRLILGYEVILEIFLMRRGVNRQVIPCGFFMGFPIFPVITKLQMFAVSQSLISPRLTGCGWVFMIFLTYVCWLLISCDQNCAYFIKFVTLNCRCLYFWALHHSLTYMSRFYNPRELLVSIAK